MLATIATKAVRDRWKGMAIGAGTMALFLLYGMSVYRDIDLSVYDSLPEAVRALMGIAEGADVASLGYGAIYGFYGALTLASLALSMGAASIAREERDGTLGLLLGNPRSRTHVLASKAVSLVLLTGLGALALWVAGLVVPLLLDVDVTGMRVGALLFHIFVNALFYGFLALGIGAWTGSRGLASGVTVAVMVLSFFAVGLFPLIEGMADAARIFPWYYLDASQPVLNGIGWGDVGVLLAGCAVFAAAAVVGVNRRDLRGATTRVTIADRLRRNPITQRLVDRLAGSTRVSRIWIKTATEHQGVTLVAGVVMFSIMGVLMGPMYALVDEQLLGFAEQLPEALMAMVGNGDMTTPEGWYQVETFSLMAPIAVMVVTLAIGARALAGEEANRTMGLLLANPIRRVSIVVDKTLAMVVLAAAVGIATFTGTALGSVLAGLGMDVGAIAATSLLVTLLGLVFGALALALGAATGRVRVAVSGAVGAALASYLLDSFLPLSDRAAGFAAWSPFHYYLSSDPLNNGMHWGHGALLALLFAALVALSIVLFQRRDLRQG